MTTKTYHRIAEGILDLINSGQFAPKSRLPPERELAARFDVSRTTVREALLALEASHIVKIRQRSGAYVLKPSERKTLELKELETSPGPHEVLQLRRLIEGEACFVAALSAPDAVVRTILDADAVRAGLPADDSTEFHEATRLFHRSIILASDNSLFVNLFDSLWEQRTSALWEHWYEGTKSRENRIASVANGHEIATAIGSRRAEAARTAMHHHIDRMIQRFLSF